MDLRFVHAADLHLDSPFRGLVADPRVRPLVDQATFRAFRRVADLCLAEKADFLVLSGDLFDTRDRSVRARLALAKELGRLDAAGIQTFAVHGNHDPLGTLSPGAGLPASVKVFGPEWEEVLVRRGGQILARVQGVSYPQEKVTENLAARFHRVGGEFTVGVLHANLGGEEGHANYAPCTLADLDRGHLDYWALGHVHTRAVHRLEGGGLAVYPGNSQGRHVNEDGERGCAVVTVRDGKPEVRWVGVEVVRWHRIEIDVSAVDTVEALFEEVGEKLLLAGQVEGPEGHAVRLRLTGRGPVHAELVKPGALEQLEEAWREELAGRAPPWILESVEDATAPALDLTALREEGGLLGAVLEGAVAARNPGVLEGLWAEDDLRKLESALRRAGVPSPREEGAALVEEAAALVAERLWEAADED